uniref:Uncharacterized protein n=1 Tax=Anguilla anguilla TaxID=7936 RepID=A0A0E9R8Z8_ANGAN
MLQVPGFVLVESSQNCSLCSSDSVSLQTVSLHPYQIHTTQDCVNPLSDTFLAQRGEKAEICSLFKLRYLSE